MSATFSCSRSPDSFVFYYGSFSSSSLYLRLEDDYLIIERSSGGNFPGFSGTLSPDESRWRAFRQDIDALLVWDWDQDYRVAHGCCDVTYWSLSLAWGHRIIATRGAFPFSSTPAYLSPPQFSQFLETVERLIASG